MRHMCSYQRMKHTSATFIQKSTMSTLFPNTSLFNILILTQDDNFSYVAQKLVIFVTLLPDCVLAQLRHS
jgi:hypothetical protein